MQSSMRAAGVATGVAVLMAAGFGVASGVAPASAAQSAESKSQQVRTTLISPGGMGRLGGYPPKNVQLSSERPATIVRLPDDLKAPLFAALPFDGGEGVVYHVILDEPEGADPRFWFDSNGNGDMLDDAAADWKWEVTDRPDGTKQAMGRGRVDLDLEPAAEGGVVSVGVYRFDKNDPAREAQKSSFYYYRDYALEGEFMTGDTKRSFLIADDRTMGDFRGGDDPAGSGVIMFIDVNGNGKYDSRGEKFDVRKPFNLGGTTYEIRGMDRLGTGFEIAVSDQSVAEVLPPPNHGIGAKITPFEAEVWRDNKVVKFPGDYAGKIVMIDFWATWCGPCMHEVPGLVKVYEKYKGQGFEVLGVSLDNDKSVEKMPGVMEEHKMTWTQVCDEKGWDAEIADLYGIRSIPQAFLVDGTTGKILADSSTLRGDALEETVRKALEDAGKLEKQAGADTTE